MILTSMELKKWIDDEKTFTAVDVRPKIQRDTAPLIGLNAVIADTDSIPRSANDLVLICQFGIITEEIIIDQNLENTFSLLGGVQSWNNYIQKEIDLSRYSRQIALPELGVAGQEKLKNATVSIIGIGGLGCPAAQSLVSAGIGHIRLIDGDKVELSNIHRQPLFEESSVGKPKAEVAAEKLSRLNKEVSVISFMENLVAENSAKLLSGSDVVIDATDSLNARQNIDRITQQLKIPMVYGGLYRYEGQVAIFNMNGSPGYKDFFPQDSSGGETCSEAGVLGMLPGIIGQIQALETVKLIAGIEPNLIGKLLIYDGMKHAMETIEL